MFNVTDFGTLAVLTSLQHLECSWMVDVTDFRPLAALTRLTHLKCGCIGSDHLRTRISNILVQTNYVTPKRNRKQVFFSQTSSHDFLSGHSFRKTAHLIGVPKSTVFDWVKRLKNLYLQPRQTRKTS